MTVDTPVLDTHGSVHPTRDLIVHIVQQRIKMTSAECTHVNIKELNGGFSGSVVLLIKPRRSGKRQFSRAYNINHTQAHVRV